MKRLLFLIVLIVTIYLPLSRSALGQCSLLSVDTMYYDASTQEIKGNIKNGSNWYVIYPFISLEIDKNDYITSDENHIVPSTLDSADGLSNGLTPFFFSSELLTTFSLIPQNTILTGSITVEDPNNKDDICVIPFQWQIKSGEIITSIEKNKRKVNLNVFPNPVSQNILNIDFNGSITRQVEVLNLGGSELMLFNLIGTEKDYQLDLSGLTKGVYLIRLLTDNGWIVRKITKI